LVKFYRIILHTVSYKRGAGIGEMRKGLRTSPRFIDGHLMAKTWMDGRTPHQSTRRIAQSEEPPSEYK